MQYLLTREELDALKNNKAIRAEYARQVEDLKQAFVGDMRKVVMARTGGEWASADLRRFCADVEKCLTHFSLENSGCALTADVVESPQ
jgi:hypothetical protein